MAVLVTATLSILVSCETDDNHAFSPDALKKSIVILYENDVHCGIDGYSQMRGLYDAIMRSDTSYVGMVSSGDFLQGDLAGAISHGQYIVDIMKNVGYDAITFGNHEFDYGVPRMQELLPQIGTNIVCANLFTYGGTTPMYQPYVIKQYGKRRIAFVGVTTPETMRSEAYSFFDENQNQLYDLRTEDCISLVQQAVDQARQEGADYVVLLAHLGEDENETGITSHTMVAATRGIDAVLDGHTHSVIPCDLVANLDGQQIPVTQTGTKFANFGKLWLSPEGKMVTQLIPNDNYDYENETVFHTTDSIKALLKQMTGRQVAYSDFPLYAIEGSSWPVRVKEMPLGDLVTDAFLNRTEAQIGIINGGGLRSNLPANVITYGDVVGVQPNGDELCIIEATGEELFNMLTKCTAKCPVADGSFPQVSGMKFTIHTASHKVTDVLIQEKGTDTYTPLDPQGKYIIAINGYYRTGGFYSTLQSCRLIRVIDQLTRDVLTDYLEKNLNGVIPAIYKESQGRITIVND